MKRCTVCEALKPFEGFARDRAKKVGRASTCKLCARARTMAWQRANPERHAANVQRWRRANPERMRDFQRKWTFGLPLGEYDRMMEVQGGGCAICGTPPNNSSLDVDHDHATGRVRGLLCRACNVGIARFRDDPKRLKTAIAYLTSNAAIDSSSTDS